MNEKTLDFKEAPEGKKGYLFSADISSAKLSISGIDIHAKDFYLMSVKNNFTKTPPKPTCFYNIICIAPEKDIIDFVAEKFEKKESITIRICDNSKGINYSLSRCYLENVFELTDFKKREYTLSFSVMS